MIKVRRLPHKQLQQSSSEGQTDVSQAQRRKPTQPQFHIVLLKQNQSRKKKKSTSEFFKRSDSDDFSDSVKKNHISMPAEKSSYKALVPERCI